jgi:hypothetical protein
MRTSELIGSALDYAVALAEGHPVSVLLDRTPGWRCAFGVLTRARYSGDWSQGGPIIEREQIELRNWALKGWEAKATDYSERPNNDHVFATALGRTPLIAAMRCYVASKLGDEIEIPTELTQ